MKLFNSLTRKKEEFVPSGNKVGVYACGPTVYSYLTIGNWRTYVLGDVLARALKYLGYKVDYRMNITDVGHLTGDNLGDADKGEDRLEKASRNEGKTAWDIAEFYTEDFLKGYKKLNLTWPTDKEFCKATEHIKEQIELVRRIEERGFVYKTSDGIYFDTGAYEKAGNKYGELSNIDQVKEGARVEANPEKRNPRDFALWKYSYKGGKPFDKAQGDSSNRRQMEWQSPWGTGFPGWHIECSAMSMKYLGEQFDIHVGGEDLRSTHHPNEIAQAEAATGKKPFVKYWIHGAFLLVDGGRMGKSLGNAYTLHDVEGKGFDPLALRYFYMTGHYRKQLNFTWEGLKSAGAALKKLRQQIFDLHDPIGAKVNQNGFLEKFEKVLDDDLNMPQALATLWDLLGSELSSEDKYGSVLRMDQVLGLGLGPDRIMEMKKAYRIPAEISELVKRREVFRKDGNFEEADKVRKQIEDQGFEVEDTDKGPRLKKA